MLKVGKLDNALLSKAVINRIKCKRPEVLVHAGVGEDCAAIDFGEYECVMSTDPITASVNDIGRHTYIRKRYRLKWDRTNWDSAGGDAAGRNDRRGYHPHYGTSC